MRVLEFLTPTEERPSLELTGRVVDGLRGLRLRVLLRIHFWQGSWFLAINEGIPYRDEVLQGRMSPGMVGQLLANEVAQVVGVQSATVKAVAYNAERRTLTVTMLVLADRSELTESDLENSFTITETLG